MKKSIAIQGLGVLALVCSSAAMAATVTIVSSTGTASPAANTDFTLTIHADGMAETAGPTLGLQINDPNVTYVSGALAGPFVGGFYVPHPSSGTPTTFDLLAPGTATGSFDAAVFTFHTTAVLAGGSTPVTFIDNSITLGNAATLAWFDANTFDPIPTTYTQFQVAAVPAPAVAWLLAPAVLAAGRFSRRRKAA